MVDWIREACGAEAHRIGILQPRFYREVSDLLAGWLAENSRDREAHRKARHLLCPWEDWVREVKAVHRPAAGGKGPSLEEEDVEAITGFLHEAGHLFLIREETQRRAVLVDQEWAAGLIYGMLRCDGELRERLKGLGGWFRREHLDEDPYWRGLADDLQRSRLLAYMEECRVVTRLTNPDRADVGRELFLATDKWLLPEFEMVEEEIELRLEEAKRRPGAKVELTFEFGDVTLSEFEFRSLQARLAREFGTRAVYFRNGLQALDVGQLPDACFRVRWQPGPEDDPFSGRMQAVLVAPEGRATSWRAIIEDLFFSADGPLADRRTVARERLAARHEMGREFFAEPGPGVFDVAVSSSGKDKAEVGVIVEALRAVGVRVNWYALPGCRLDENEKVWKYMNSLSRQPCVVLVLSEGYLRKDAVENWYCAWELADAVLRLGQGRRSADRTLVVYKGDGGVTSRDLTTLVHSLFNHMAEALGKLYADKAVRDRRNFQYYNELSRHFVSALEQGYLRKLYDERGTFGTYLKLPPNPAAPGAMDAIVAAVLKVTKPVVRRDTGGEA